MPDGGVELLPKPPPLVTTRAPNVAVTSSEIAQPYQVFGQTLKEAGDALTDISVRTAKYQASQDLIDQKVTRSADGTVTVQNPSTAPLLFGPAGDAYEHAMAAGTVANVANEVSQQLNELHQKFPADAGGFQKASSAFIDGLGTGMPAELHEAIVQQAKQQQTQHFNAITDRAGSISIEAQKNALLAQKSDLIDTLTGLARAPGGTDSPEFKQTAAQLDHLYDSFGTNPLFKTSPEQIDIEKKNTHAMLQGEAVVGVVDDTFNKRGKAAAQQVLQQSVLDNPNLREADRTRLYSQGMARLQFLSSDAKERLDANRAVTGEIEKTLADRKLSPDDPVVGMAIQRAITIGDTEGAQRLTAAAAVARQLRGVDALPDAERNHVLGRGGQEPVNQTIPPEGRALLKTIGATESGNRYDTRYTANGGVAFGNFANHPDVAEPITSGPDAGKTSTAAGYYQFLNSTWQAQKAKLGLTDFSPANQDAAAWDLAQTTYQQKTGKDLLTTLKSGDKAAIAGVLPALSGQWSSLPGGRQPAQRYLAPSLSGGPGFTADDVQRNPFLLSAYVRSQAADPELRIQSAKQTAAAIGKTLDNGFLPSPNSVAEVNQAARLYPEKMGAVADEMNGRLNGVAIAQVPADQREAVLETYREATAGPDVHQINLAAAALAQVDRQDQNMREHPLTEGARRGWVPDPAPIDPQKPDTIAPALAQRADASARIGSRNNMPAPPLVDKDDMPKLQAALQAPTGAQVLGSIQQTLKPEQLQPLLGQEPFRNAVTGMSRSGDPAKMNAAYSFMDALQKQNPLQFNRQFPDGLNDLRAWQSNLAFYPPDEAAKRIMRAYDPAQSAARDAAEKVANKALESVSPANVVSKFSTGLWPFGTSAGAPVSEQAGMAAGALKADYDQMYRDGFVRTGDPAAADKFAVEKLNLKYGVSPANSGRVMAYPPERYYPDVGGSKEWMTNQLDDAIAAQLNVKSGPDLTGALANAVEPTAALMDQRSPAERQYAAQHALVADEITQRDIANGRLPSYQVVLQNPDGRWEVMSGANNLPAAKAAMNLTPQEEFLYQRHLTNLAATNGGVPNPEGGKSTLFQMSFESGGRTYNIPTVWDGKFLKPDDAIKRATAEGLDKWPSYPNEGIAYARYMQMHAYMEKDLTSYGVPQRFRFDPSGPVAANAATMEERRAQSIAARNEPAVLYLYGGGN